MCHFLSDIFFVEKMLAIPIILCTFATRIEKFSFLAPKKAV